jgi:hypothetical protein
LVFPAMPSVSYVVEKADLIDSAGGMVPVSVAPQSGFLAAAPGIARSRTDSGTPLDAQGVIGFGLPSEIAPGTTLSLSMRVVPDEALAEWIEHGASWQPPHVESIIGAE